MAQAPQNLTAQSIDCSSVLCLLELELLLIGYQLLSDKETPIKKLIQM